MAGLRDIANVTVEASWSTDPDETPSWESIDTVESVTIGPRGRSYELDEVTPGRATLRVDNSAGLYKAGATIGAGTVTTDKRIRVRAALVGGSTYTLLDHTITACPSTVTGFDYGTSQFETIDYLDALGTRVLGCAYLEHILWEGPTALWTLGEPAGSTTVGDLIGGGTSSIVSAFSDGNTTPGSAAFGADPFFPSIADPTTNLSFAPHTTSGVSDGGKVVQLGRAGTGKFLTGSSWGLRLSFATTNDVNGAGYLFYQSNGDGITDAPLYVYIGTFGTMQIRLADGTTYNPAGTYNDGLVHTLQIIATGASTRIYMDGVLLTSTTAISSADYTRQGYCTLGGRLVTGTGAIDSPYTGRLGYVAFFDSGFIASGKSLTEHYSGTTGFVGDTADQRIFRILEDWTGYPGTTDITTGSTPLAAAQTFGKTAAQVCLDAARADDGVFFIGADGSPTFRPRTARYSTTPVVTLHASGQAQPISFGGATFGGFLGRPLELPVDTDQLTFNLDRQLLVNDFFGTYPGGPTVRFKDAASITKHRIRNPGSGTLTFEVASASDLNDAAAWFLFRYSEPRVRVGSVRLRPFIAPALAKWACSLRPFDHIRIVGLPSGAPESTMDFIVESVSHPRIENSEWITELALSPWIPVLTIDDPIYGAIDSYPVGL